MTAASRLNPRPCNRRKGNGTINGYMVRPANAAGKLPVVLVVHENRGLNPYIKDVARSLAIANFMAFAPDGLTLSAAIRETRREAAKLFLEVDRGKMTRRFFCRGRRG